MLLIKINRIETQKINNWFANKSTTFFVNKFNASFMVLTCFGAEILLHCYFMAQNQRIFAAIFSFFLPEEFDKRFN